MPSRNVPTAIDDKTAAAEGAWAFHVATHNLAFATTDCCSSDLLYRTMFFDSEVAKKFEIADKDELFEEVVELNRMLRQIPEEVLDAEPAESKWQKIFKVRGKDFRNVFKLLF